LRRSGRTSGLTDFDDELLQQGVDVSRMLPGSGLADGYMRVRQEAVHVATGSLFVTTDPYAIIEAQGISRTQTRCWVLGCHHERLVPAGGDSVTLVAAGVRLPQVGGIVGTHDVPVLGCNAFSFALVAGGRQYGVISMAATTFDRSLYVAGVNVPLRVDPGGLLLYNSAGVVAVGPTDSNVVWRLWFGPIGLNPPGVA